MPGRPDRTAYSGGTGGTPSGVARTPQLTLAVESDNAYRGDIQQRRIGAAYRVGACREVVGISGRRGVDQKNN